MITSDIKSLSDINISAKTLYENKDYRTLFDFSSLNNYYVFVKQTTTKIELEQTTQCQDLTKTVQIKISKNSVENAFFKRNLLGGINPTPFTVQDNLPKSLNDYINFNILGNIIHPKELQTTINELINITNHSIYCLIKNGKIAIFTPLYKIDNKNKQYSSILLQNIDNILDKLLEKYSYYPETSDYLPIHKNANVWNKDGCVLHTKLFEFNDLYYRVIYHMFEVLCQTSVLPDTDLIIYIGEQLRNCCFMNSRR